MEKFAKQNSSIADILLISGVNISKPNTTNSEFEPVADYSRIIDDLKPHIIDSTKVNIKPKFLYKWLAGSLGIPWIIAIKAFFRAKNYRLVIATGEDVGLPFALLAKIFGRRYRLIVTCHNIATRRPRFFLKTLKVATKVTKFQCLSSTQANMLNQLYGIDKSKTQVIDWHVDHEFFYPLPDVTVKNQICSAGMANRDYATLVEATRDLNTALKIAADSPWFNYSLNISPETINSRMEVKSYGNYKNLRRLYAESLFVVVPLVDVPFSAGYTVILEAMAMGKAVIVARIKQKDDFLVDGWNGLYYTPGDSKELREKITYLLDHPDEARRMGANGRQRVIENFTLDHYVQQMRDATQP